MIFNPFERMVAGRYLRARKQEGFVSVMAAFSFLGIMLGVAALIIVMSVMNGFRSELLNRILGLNGHMNIYSYSRMFHGYDKFTDELKDLKDVAHVFPMIEGQALLKANEGVAGVVVRGVSTDDFVDKPLLSQSIVSGGPNLFTGFSVAIGEKLARRYNLKVGDKLVLVSPDSKASPFGSMPRSRSFNVAMIFDVGMFEYDSGFVYIPLKAAQAFYRKGDTVSALEVFTRDPNNIDPLRKYLDDKYKEELFIQDWRESNASFFNALVVERNVMAIILSLIIIVAAFNIISSMTMLVKDKGHDIAIMRTMGATRKNMRNVFLLTGGVIGFCGTAFGALLGISFALNIEKIRQFVEKLIGMNLFSDEIYFLSKLPAQIEWSQVITIIVGSFLLTLLVTLFPARRAARLDPVEALRYE